MHAPLLLLAAFLLLGAQAKPEGYYHAESSFRRSSSSYQNNELQHQNQDEGFHSEDGDLERKTKPKVNSYVQHSEYVNPKLRTGEYNSQQGIDSGFGSNYDSQYAGSSLGSTSQYAHGNSYRAGANSASYGVASNLEELTRRLQSDLSRQLQHAISEEYAQSSAYSRSSTSQMQQDIRRFEDELRANLTRKLQQALNEQYGQQTVSGPYSYSITRGSPSHTANYNTQELEDLKRQLETDLVSQLQQEVRTHYEASESRSSYGSSNQDTGTRYTYSPRPAPLSTGSQVYGTNNNYGSAGVKTAHRPTDYYPYRYPDQSGSSSSYGETSNVGYTSSSSVVYRLTDLVTEVQHDLSRVIDEILDEEQRKNTELIGRGVRPNYDESFQYLRQLLIRNITDRIDDKIRQYYGTQIETDDHFYSLTAGGTKKSQPNYSREDLERLKQQIEDNLVEKLSYGIRQQESRYDEERRYVETHRTRQPSYTNSHSSSSSFNSASQYGSSPSYRPSSVVPLRTGSQTSTAGQYDYLNTHRQSGYEINPDSQVELTNIQQQLQNDLSRQLQYAIREQTKEYATYGSSGSVGSSSYQTALQQLTEELKRNLTEQLQRSLNQAYGDQRSRGSYSYSVTSGGSLGSTANYNQQQLEDITRRLQENLIGQLQDGLRQSWSSEYSYSASSSSSNYNRPAYGVKSGAHGVKGHSQSYTQYGADDCDETGYGGHYRGKRAVVLRNRGDIPKNSAVEVPPDQDDLTQQLEDGFGGYQQQQQLQQQARQYGDLTQQQEDVFDYYRTQQQQQQRGNLEDLTQQQEDNFYYKPKQQQQQQRGNLEDLTQQQEDNYKPQQQQPRGYGDLTQQLDVSDYNRNQQQQQQQHANLEVVTPQQEHNVYTLQQQAANLGDLTPQQQYGNVYTQQQQDLTQQQQQEDYYGNQQQVDQVETAELGNNQQQVETLSLNNAPGFGAVHQQPPSEKLQKNPKADDLTQQLQPVDIYGDLQIGSQYRQSRTTTEASDQYQQQNQDDLTQQNVEDNYEWIAQGRTDDSIENVQVGNSQYNYVSRRTSTTEKQLVSTTEKYNGQQQQQEVEPQGVIPLSSSVSQQTQQQDLTQQLEDGFGNLEIASQKLEQPKNSDQQSQDLTQQSSDLTQQTEDGDVETGFGSQQADAHRKPATFDQENLTQQTENDGFGRFVLGSQRNTDTGYNRKPGASDQRDLTQQTEDGFENFDLRSTSNTKPNAYDQSDLTQQTEDGFADVALGSSNEWRGENSREFSQQNLNSHTLETGSQRKPNPYGQQQQQTSHSDEDLTQQSIDEPTGRQDGSPSYYPPGYQGPTHTPFSSRNYRYNQNTASSEERNPQRSSSNSPYSRGLYKITPLGQYAVQQAEQQSIENDSEEVEDLVQKPIEKHAAYQLYDVSQQAEVRQLPEEQQSSESLEQLGGQENQTEQPPGFWKKVGSKFTNAYTSVKDKAKEVFG